MSLLEKLKLQYKNYQHNEDGNIIILSVFLMFSLVGMTALVVETGLLREHSARNMEALDTVALANASKRLRNGDDGNARTTDQNYWNENKREDDLRSTGDVNRKRRGSGTNEGAEFRTTVEQKTTFGNLFGAKKMEAHEKSFASIRIAPVDITFMLDMSRGMSGNNWREARNAIAIFGDSFFGWSPQAQQATTMSVIPYDDNVNFKNHHYFLRHLHPSTEITLNQLWPGDNKVYSRWRTDGPKNVTCKQIKYTRYDGLSGSRRSSSGEKIRYTENVNAYCKKMRTKFYPDSRPVDWPWEYWPKWGMVEVQQPYKYAYYATGYKRVSVACDDDPYTYQPRDAYGCYQESVSDQKLVENVYYSTVGYIELNGPHWTGCLRYETGPEGQPRGVENLFKDQGNWEPQKMIKTFLQTSCGNLPEPNLGKIKNNSALKQYISRLNPSSYYSAHEIGTGWTNFYIQGQMSKYLEKNPTELRRYVIHIVGQRERTSKGNTSTYEKLHKELCGTLKTRAEVFVVNLSTDSKVKEITKNCAGWANGGENLELNIHSHDIKTDSLQGAMQAIAGYIKKDWVALGNAN